MKEKKGTNKVTVAKIFPVPFPLTLNQGNLTINTNTNTHTQNSKEKLINQAFKFHSQGNILEAAKYYKNFINQGLIDHRVFSNYGNILKNLGKFKDAEISTRKAIEIKPDFAEAYSNLGGILKDLVRLKEAEFSYRKAIEIKPDYAKAHYNLGIILSELGKSQDAELSYRKAIKIKPDYAEAHYNLGIILSEIGKSQDAELSYRKAIEIKPDYGKAHYNLGIILREIGNLKEAELTIRKAIEFKPDDADAYHNLGTILKDLGKLQEAFDSFLKSIEINPILSNTYNVIARFLRDSDLSQLDKSKLKEILNILLERNDISHQELFNVFNFLCSNKIISNLEKIESNFYKIESLVNDKTIISAFKKMTFKDIRLEKLLTNLRKYICIKYTEIREEISYSQLQFIIALGEQCFLNEYVYSLSEDENISINTIIQRCQDGEVNETNIVILSCYFPLYKLLDQIPSLKYFKSSNKSFKELIELQITKPLKEIELSKNIKKLGSINDDVSQIVKSQYEENPYPRWRYGNNSETHKISTLKVINNEINPNNIIQAFVDEQLKVLIAGCGTGNQILQAQRYKNAQIKAIDLSLSSLSYAQRKINELEIENVELIQMDILEVDLLKDKFDIIECSGVLHHMEDPEIGLKALLKVLKNNGFLKLGLYSELARQDIVKARNYIASKKLQANEFGIRAFRETIFSGERPELNSLLTSNDFYTLSSCRDLCFHAQEHRFTINQLRETLKSNKLNFLGFLLPQLVKSVYGNYFPEDKKQTNLQNWGKFEKQHPTTFSSMYQFWVSKGE